MSEQDLTQAELQAFNDRVFSIIVTELTTLPFNQLCRMHDQLVDQHAEAANSTQESAASFGLMAMGEAIRRRQVARALN